MRSAERWAPSSTSGGRPERRHSVLPLPLRPASTSFMFWVKASPRSMLLPWHGSAVIESWKDTGHIQSHTVMFTFMFRPHFLTLALLLVVLSIPATAQV